MALTLTDLQDAIIRNNNVDKYEVRRGSYGFYDVALRNQGNLISKDIVAQKRSLEQSVKIPVLNKGHVGDNGGRITGAFPSQLGTSAMVDVVTQTFQRHFSIQPAENFGNYIEYEKELAKAMRELELELLADMDGYIHTQVNAGRSQADNSNAYPFTSDSYDVPNTEYQKLLYKLSAIYRANNYNGESLNIVANAMYEAEINELLEHSQQNDQNKVLRLVNKNISFSNAIVPAGTHEIFASTNSGYEIVNFNEPDAILSSMVTEAEYKGEVKLPLTGLTFGLYFKKEFVLNEQGTAKTLMENYSFATDLSVILPYLSDPANDPAVNTKFELE